PPLRPSSKYRERKRILMPTFIHTLECMWITKPILRSTSLVMVKTFFQIVFARPPRIQDSVWLACYPRACTAVAAVCGRRVERTECRGRLERHGGGSRDLYLRSGGRSGRVEREHEPHGVGPFGRRLLSGSRRPGL